MSHPNSTVPIFVVVPVVQCSYPAQAEGLVNMHQYLHYLEARHFRPLAIGVQLPVSHSIPIWQRTNLHHWLLLRPQVLHQSEHMYIYIYIYWKHVRGETVIFKGIRRGDLSSNPGWCCLRFTLFKCHFSSSLASRADWASF